MKKIISTLFALALALILLPFAVNAETIDSGTCGSDVSWTLTDDGALTITGIGAMSNYTKTTMPWAANKDMITKVIIGENITQIGEYAFYECANLTDLQLASTLGYVGDYAFYKCANLQNVSGTSAIVSVYDYAFYGCKKLTSLPGANLRTVGQWAFAYCSALNQISLASSMTAYDFGAGAFSDCTSLTEVTIPTSVNEIPDCAFYNCTNLRKVVTHYQIKQIWRSAFANCTNLTDFTMPSWLTHIYGSAFMNSGIGNVSFNSNLQYIEPSAFAGCQNMTSITVTNNSTYKSVDGILFAENGTVLHTYPAGKTGEVDPPYAGNALKEIEAYAFAGCTGITSVKIPNQCTRIGGYAFQGCTSLTSFTSMATSAGAGVSTIANYAFEGCTALTWVQLPNGIEKLSNSLFKDCTALDQVVIPSTVTEISASAFSGCTDRYEVLYDSSSSNWNRLTSGMTTFDNIRVHYNVVYYTNHWSTSRRDPTCVNDGYTKETCSCGYTRNETTLPASGIHVYDRTKVDNAYKVSDATCTKKAVYYMSCSCGKAGEETFETGAVLDHSYANDVCSVCNTVKISESIFPDENFRSFLTSQDYGEDGLLTTEELSSITYLDVSHKNIADLTGIEHFTSLTYLYCYDNKLTSLDVSKNTALTGLRCDNNQLTSLDVSKNTALTWLDCSSNPLTSLDVSKNTALTDLDCYGNQLTNLDVSKNTALTWLACSGNPLTSLDVSKNTALEYLWCNINQLTSLDVSKNTALRELYCHENQLTSLDVSKNTALTWLDCSSNQLTSLDGSNNTALTYLQCSYNQLTNLDVSKNTALKTLVCYSNQLTSLDVSKNTALTVLDCGGNQLTSLDVRKNTALKYLTCLSNQLTSLDVRKNTALVELNCGSNQLTSLDVSKNTALLELNCGSNQLTSLDVSKNTALEYLWCDSNQLTSLDLSKNTALTDLDCSQNSRRVSASQNKVDLSTLATDGFDVSKASNWKGGTVNGNILTATSNKVTYTYDLGNGSTATFALLLDGFCDHIWNAATCDAPKTCVNCGATEGTKLEHQMGDWAVIKEATDTAEGEKKRSCMRIGCDYFETEVIPKLSGETLATPTLKASNVASTGKIKLTWEKVEGAAKYEVYRATSKTGSYSLLKAVTGTSLTNTSATTGKTYYYKVRSVAEDGTKSDWSSIVSRTCDLPQPSVKASNVASSGKITLTWEKVEGATEYKVYRATSKDGTYTLMKTTTGTSYTNTSAKTGSTYYYKVRAIHSSSSANSAYSAIVSRACDLPQPVVTISNVASSGKIKLTWDEVEGATEYKVYRATSEDGTYTLMKTTTSTSYTNTSTEAGKAYYYKVMAIHSKSAANSAYSAIVSRTCDLARPDVTVKLSSGNVKVTWEKVSGATEYKVYRATSKDGTYKLMKTTTGTSYTNTSVTSGKTYYYKVKAIHSNSAANSAYSSIDSIKVK